MDTAKVDIRKLQMLNDRINQTIDALNQVRLSVHGISHTGQMPGNAFGTPSFGAGSFGVPQSYAQQPYAQQPYMTPFGVNPQVAGGINFAQTNGMGVHPYAAAAAAQNNPFLAQQLWGNTVGQQFGQQFGVPTGGLGHTNPEMVDPALYARSLDGNVGRIAQTFPFVQWGYSPFAQGYSPFGSATY